MRQSAGRATLLSMAEQVADAPGPAPYRQPAAGNSAMVARPDQEEAGDGHQTG